MSAITCTAEVYVVLATIAELHHCNMNRSYPTALLQQVCAPSGTLYQAAERHL